MADKTEYEYISIVNIQGKDNGIPWAIKSGAKLTDYYMNKLGGAEAAIKNKQAEKRAVKAADKATGKAE